MIKLKFRNFETILGERFVSEYLFKSIVRIAKRSPYIYYRLYRENIETYRSLGKIYFMPLESVLTSIEASNKVYENDKTQT